MLAVLEATLWAADGEIVVSSSYALRESRMTSTSLRVRTDAE